MPRDERLVARFATRLRELRLREGVSQTELGSPYLTRAAISSLERGVTAPSLHVLAFLAQKLGVRPGTLLDDSHARVRDRPALGPANRGAGTRRGTG